MLIRDSFDYNKSLIKMLKPAQIVYSILAISYIIDTASTLIIQGEAIEIPQELLNNKRNLAEVGPLSEVMSEVTLDYLKVTNCAFSSNLVANLFFCDNGKVIV